MRYIFLGYLKSFYSLISCVFGGFWNLLKNFRKILVTRSISRLKLLQKKTCRAYFSHILRGSIRMQSPFWEIKCLILYQKFQKHMLFRVCSILNALNLRKWGVKIHNCALLLDFFPFFCYTASMPLFSEIILNNCTSNACPEAEQYVWHILQAHILPSVGMKKS